MGLIINDAEAGDLPALLRIESIFPSDRISARQFRYHLANPRALLLVAREGLKSEALGYALFLTRKGQMARFYSLAVSPKAQGRGLGRQLCEVGFARLVNMKVPAVSLEVDVADKKAAGLYRSLGFEDVAVMEDYYEDHRDALKMKKVLKGPKHG